MNEEALFETALEKPAAERAAFLAEACGTDVAMRQRLETLLVAHDLAGDFLERPLAETTETPQQPDLAAFLVPAARPDSLGRLNHYELLELLGQGGYGIVYRAFDDVLHRVVAVKVLAPHLAATSPARKRFLREARSAAQVRHENVVQIYAVEEQPLPFLVMEFIPGETLQQRLDRTGPLAVGEIVRLGRQIAEGLAAAHATGLIHRDVKPANVLIEHGPQDRVKLTDFGLARAADDASISQSGLVVGTPLYMSPEQARGEHVDLRADLFSLGSVLYAMCSGRPPFRAPNTLAVLRRVAEDTPRPIKEIIPEVPGWLCDLIAHLHAKRAEDRVQTAQEVVALLNDPTQRPRSRAIRPLQRGKRLVAGAVAVILLFVGLGMTEATGVTKLRGSIVRLFTPDGVLVIETDDPDVRIAIDGEEMVITGAGMKELRVRPGQHQVSASKDGKLLSQQLVTVTKAGRQVVRVSREHPQPQGNHALEFDGFSSYVHIPSLSRDDDDGPLTIEAFVTVAGTAGAVLVRIEGKSPCQLYGWPGGPPDGWVPNGQDHARVKMIAANTPPLTVGRRAHLALQLDKDELQLFVDGRLVNRVSRGATPGAGGRRGTLFGGEMSRPIANLFTGKLDEVRLSRVLRYRGEFTPTPRFEPDKDTLALYHCDEGSGDKLIDCSGNGHHGKAVNVRWVKVE